MIDGASISGNVQDDDNRAGDLRIQDAYVGGNIQLEQGTSAAVVRTSIDGDLGSDGFRDVPDDHVHAEGIAWLAAAGITGGCTEDGRDFYPGQALARAQMATFLDHTLDLPDANADRQPAAQTGQQRQDPRCRPRPTRLRRRTHGQLRDAFVPAFRGSHAGSLRGEHGPQRARRRLRGS